MGTSTRAFSARFSALAARAASIFSAGSQLRLSFDR
jgi:hypothetical protein